MSSPRLAPSPVPTVAAFDFDGTLLKGDSLLILQRLLHRPATQAAIWLGLVPSLVAWKAGWRNTAWFKQRWLRASLAATDRQRLGQVLVHDLPTTLRQRLRPEALARLEWHRNQGHRVVIVSASPRALLEPVARSLKAELIATETSDPLAHSVEAPISLTSPNCKGPEKVRRLKEWLGSPLSETELHAYGDSPGDRDLLLASDVPHWRSFGPEPVAVPPQQAAPPWAIILAALLLGLAIAGLVRLAGGERAALMAGLRSVLLWLPCLYALLVVSYSFRYWRWRILLGAQGIGRSSWEDALAWFRGFALTATPAKLGELTRVHQLHRQLGYPQGPLVHVFVAERLTDASAVVGWLLLLAPAQISAQLSGGRLREGILAVAAAFVLLTLALAHRPLRRMLRRWRHHLPSGSLARATVPAAGVSLLVWASEAMLFWWLITLLSPLPLSPPMALGIYLISGTAGMASSLPGGLGVNEAATVLLLQQQGIPASTGLPIAILRRLITPWSVVALAMILSGLRSPPPPQISEPSPHPPLPGG